MHVFAVKWYRKKWKPAYEIKELDKTEKLLAIKIKNSGKIKFLVWDPKFILFETYEGMSFDFQTLNNSVLFLNLILIRKYRFLENRKLTFSNSQFSI